MENPLSVSALFSWVLMLLFITIGVLNLLKIDLVTGIFYLLFSLIYCPLLDNLLRKKVGFSMPYLLKIILAFLVLWGTLAVGDLAEMYGL